MSKPHSKYKRTTPNQIQNGDPFHKERINRTNSLPPLPSPLMATTPLPVLPPDLEHEILIRLPSKSLHRFTSVSKSWNSQITNPNFITSHHNHHSLLSPQLLLLHYPPPHISISSHSLTSLTPLPVPVSDPPPPLRVHFLTSRSINGIVCVTLEPGTETDSQTFLWNPSTSESVKLPISGDTHLPNSGFPVVSGFGYDAERDDYKILRILYNGYGVVPRVEVYSLRENCWRGLDSHSGISSNTLWASSVSVFVNGVGHWGVYQNERKEGFFVMGFDFGKECFKRIKLPMQCVDGVERRYHGLWVFNGWLAVSVLRFGEFESGVTRHYIWVMSGEVKGLGRQSPIWVNLFNIDLEGGPSRPVTALRTGELLLRGEGDGEYVLYDRKKEEVRSLDVFGVETVVPYVESAVCLSKLLPSQVVG